MEQTEEEHQELEVHTSSSSEDSSDSVEEESIIEELDMQQKLEYSEEEVKEQCTIIKEVGPNLEYEQSTREIPA